MYRRLDSPEGARFLALIREGKGLKPSARAAGVGKETGYRWLCEAFVQLRGTGLGSEAAQARLGFSSSRVNEWERKFQQDDGRHHFQVAPDVEAAFWASYQEGASLAKATQGAGVSRATGYRWLYNRFTMLRASNGPARVRKELRLLPGTAATWEKRWKTELAVTKKRLDRAHHAGIQEHPAVRRTGGKRSPRRRLVVIW